MTRFPALVPRVFHAATFGLIMFIVYQLSRMEIPDDMKVNMPSLRTNWWQYLTVWNMVFQGFFFLFCFVDDLLQSFTPRKMLVDVKERLVWAKDILYQSLTLPLCMCVFLVFWVVFTYDRELIYPSGMDAIVPFWYNHLIHTTIVIFPWAEMFISQRPFARFKICYLLGMALLALYNVAVIGASYWQGYWTYPLLNKMTPIQRGGFFAFLYSLYTTTYVVGCRVNDKICGPGPCGSGEAYQLGSEKKLP